MDPRPPAETSRVVLTLKKRSTIFGAAELLSKKSKLSEHGVAENFDACNIADSSQVGFDDMSNELLVNIFQFVDLPDQTKLQSVCKRWYAVLRSPPVLPLFVSINVNKEMGALLRNLDFKHCRNSFLEKTMAVAMEHMVTLHVSRSEELDISETSDAGLAVLKAAHQTYTPDLRQVAFSDVTLDARMVCFWLPEQVRRLSLTGVFIWDLFPHLEPSSPCWYPVRVFVKGPLVVDLPQFDDSIDEKQRHQQLMLTLLKAVEDNQLQEHPMTHEDIEAVKAAVKTRDGGISDILFGTEESFRNKTMPEVADIDFHSLNPLTLREIKLLTETKFTRNLGT